MPTIGWGNTFYPNGKKVTLRDKPLIDQGEADRIFRFVLSLFEKDVNSLFGKTPVKQHQFDALVSFAYNVGSDIDEDDIPEGLGDSTLLKLVKANPDDPRIPAEFAKWKRSNGKVSKGLVRRRKVEGEYYQTGILKF
ncbi:MAG: lysozyme [Flavihumibacter sp.]|nr:lysozyme [Flavihumibacter sp.]